MLSKPSASRTIRVCSRPAQRKIYVRWSNAVSSCKMGKAEQPLFKRVILSSKIRLVSIERYINCTTTFYCRNYIFRCLGIWKYNGSLFQIRFNEIFFTSNIIVFPSYRNYCIEFLKIVIFSNTDRSTFLKSVSTIEIRIFVSSISDQFELWIVANFTKKTF